MAAAVGGRMTVVGGVAAMAMTGGTMCMALALAEPQVVERRMVAAAAGMAAVAAAAVVMAAAVAASVEPNNFLEINTD